MSLDAEALLARARVARGGVSAPRILLLDDVLAAAERILADPARNVVRVAQDEILTLAVLALQQHRMIVAAGLAYPKLPAVPGTEAR